MAALSALEATWSSAWMPGKEAVSVSTDGALKSWTGWRRGWDSNPRATVWLDAHTLAGVGRLATAQPFFSERHFFGLKQSSSTAIVCFAFLSDDG